MLSASQHNSARGIFQHQVHIVGDQDDGHTQLVDLYQEFHDLGVVAEVLPGGGFVQDEDLGSRTRMEAMVTRFFCP